MDTPSITTETIARFALGRYKHKPFSLRDFIERKDMMNAHHSDGRPIIWPLVMDDLVEMNNGVYQEAVLTGGIGVAKTTLALYSTAYQLYLLSCMKKPHELYDLDPSSEILFIFQSITATLAKMVDYKRFRDMIENAPYFSEHFPCNPEIKSEMQFPNRIVVRPVSGVATAAIGQNVIGGVIDELNYMNVVEKSMQSVDRGTYDQAIEVYNSIARRRESRFQKKGVLPGLLCLVSSTRYPGEFTDDKKAEALINPHIYVYDKRHWDIRPEVYGDARFLVFVGDDSRKPRILDPGEAVDVRDRELVIPVPEEKRIPFEKDIINALREIAGVATLARFPYIMNNEALAAAFGHHRSIMSKTSVDFSREEAVFFANLFQEKHKMRCIHVDLALTGDAVGMSCGYVPRFVRIERGEGIVEIMPEIHIDFTLRITPPPNDEIKFDKIRALIYKLRQYGLNIRWVSFDSYQSRYLMQLLIQQGLICPLVSCDKDSVPYDFLKGAIYDSRIKIPADKFAKTELAMLEKDPKTGKVDHPPHGSKDVADSLAGVVYGLTMKRMIWAEHNISPVQIPQYIRDMGQRPDTGNTEPPRPRA